MQRNLKKLILRLLNPLDYAARVVNGKADLPPLHLRWDVGPLRGYESSSAEYRVLLKLFAGLLPQSRVLDIGCGCGQMALELRQDLDADARYVGCDISREAIGWCNRRIAAGDGRFAFHHIDVRNGMYNPRGTQSAGTYRFPTAWKPFDVILMKSIFTHMRREEVENYISQLPMLLTTAGKCLATFFLLNDDQRSMAKRGENRIHFIQGQGGAAYVNPHQPEAIVAFEESVVRDMITRHGLEICQPIHYGTWTGRKDRLSHQDIILLQKAR